MLGGAPGLRGSLKGAAPSRRDAGREEVTTVVSLGTGEEGGKHVTRGELVTITGSESA